jgi:hypothetical protein
MSRSAKGTVGQPGGNVRQKARLNRGILDNEPGERRRQLVYKMECGGPPRHGRSSLLYGSGRRRAETTRRGR